MPYRKWLDRQSHYACKRFSGWLDSEDEGNVEGAVGEAVAWNWLNDRCDHINLNEDDATGGVDFRCESVGKKFFVEVTTLTTSNLVNSTGLQREPSQGTKIFYHNATRAIQKKIINKAKQVARLDKRLDKPLVIFVSTLHFKASYICLQKHHLRELLTGSKAICSRVDPTGLREPTEQVQVETPDHSLFFASGSLDPKRKHVSAVLVGGFGVRLPECNVVGVLHPEPARRFEVACLPEVCFGRLDPWPRKREVRVVWSRSNGEICDDEAEDQRVARHT